MLIDSHAHLNDEAFDADREEVVFRARENGIKLILNVGYDLPSSEQSVALAEKYELIYAAVGIHPHDAESFGAQALEKLINLSRHDKVVAIGEIGLDYYRDLSPRDLQKQAFVQQLNLARELKLPVIIHDRDAHGDIINVLKEERAYEIGGVLHCFSGSYEMAVECMKMGFYISIAGPVTFPNAARLQDVAARIPLDRLLVETDAPYLAPQTHRGKRNESAYVKHVAEKIASIRGMKTEEIMKITTENMLKCFRIKF